MFRRDPDVDLPVAVLNVPPLTSLRHVELNGISLPWGLWNLTNLQSLELWNLRDTGPTVSDLHTILLASPHLTELGLRHFMSRQATDGGKEKRRPIPLPHLTSLILHAIPDELQSYILSTIVSSNLQTFMVYGLSDQQLHAQSAALLAPALEPFPSLIITNSHSGNEVHMEGSLYTLNVPDVYESADDVAPVCLSLQGPTSLAPAAKWLATFIDRDLKVTVEVNGGGDDFPPDDTAMIPFSTSVLVSLSNNITTITVKIQQDALAILHALSERRVDGNGIPYWLCPNLTHLDLSLVPGLTDEDIDTFLTGRWAAGDDPERRPKPLEVFVLPAYLSDEPEMIG